MEKAVQGYVDAKEISREGLAAGADSSSKSLVDPSSDKAGGDTNV